MLTRTRRQGESLFLMVDRLDDPIEVKLTDICNHNQAKISVDAPQRIRIVREELLWERRDPNANYLAGTNL